MASRRKRPLPPWLSGVTVGKQKKELGKNIFFFFNFQQLITLMSSKYKYFYFININEADILMCPVVVEGWGLEICF